MGDHGIADQRTMSDDHLGIAEDTIAEDTIAVSVPARADTLPIVRSVVEHALFAADWVFDDVVDVKLAVDEVCSQLVAGASDWAPRLHLAIDIDGADFWCAIETVVDPRFTIDTTGFGWRVVEAVTDARSVSYSERGAPVVYEGAARQSLVDGDATSGAQAARTVRVRIAKRGSVE